ncbi:hypothetical protein KI387_044754 [Taxus chinensis]|uniref:Uncharacterized protein n=1 Tax=Taxus chinensis TaxID=29808 RepID=A0AA38FCY3_TAXCH|nr:hypothetical protein KI387_044754 [Taxus chinensis]
MFSWLDDEATDGVVVGNNHGERGVLANKSFDDGVCLGLIGGHDTWGDGVDTPMDLCMGAEGASRFKENTGGGCVRLGIGEVPSVGEGLVRLIEVDEVFGRDEGVKMRT